MRLWTRVQRWMVQMLMPQQPRGWRNAPPRRSTASRAVAFGSLGLCLLAVLVMFVGLVAGDESSELPAARAGSGVSKAPAEKTARSSSAERSRHASGRRHKRKHRKHSAAATRAPAAYAGSAGAASRPAVTQATRTAPISRRRRSGKSPARGRAPGHAQNAPAHGVPATPTTPTVTTAPPSAPAPPPTTTAPSAPAGDGGSAPGGNGPDGNGPPGQRAP